MRERAWRSGQGRARKLRDVRQYRPLHGCDRQETRRVEARPLPGVRSRCTEASAHGSEVDTSSQSMEIERTGAVCEASAPAPGDLTTAVPVTVGRARIELSDLLFVIKASKLVLNRIAAAVGRYRRAWYRLSEHRTFRTDCWRRPWRMAAGEGAWSGVMPFVPRRSLCLSSTRSGCRWCSERRFLLVRSAR